LYPQRNGSEVHETNFINLKTQNIDSGEKKSFIWARCEKRRVINGPA